MLLAQPVRSPVPQEGQLATYGAWGFRERPRTERQAFGLEAFARGLRQEAKRELDPAGTDFAFALGSAEEAEREVSAFWGSDADAESLLAAARALWRATQVFPEAWRARQGLSA